MTFSLSLMLAVLAIANVPTPASVFGFEPCDERQLATYEEISSYFRELDAASDRMNLYEIGETAEGRTMLMAVISSEANLARLDHFKSIAQRLARARDLTDGRARELAAEGKAVVWIDFGLHSTERAHAQTAPLMGYQAVTSEAPEWKSIRDNVIFILIPNINPDGTTLVVDWYRKVKGTPYEESNPPELYQKYVGHDNNRDWYMFNQPESQSIARQLYEEWFPQIIYNQHQEAPFPARIFVPPFEDPMNPNIPPLVMRGINLVGEAMTRRFDQEKKAGVVSRLQFDTWWNGGMRTAPYYHNMVGILTETGHSSPMTIEYDPEEFPKTFANGESTSAPSTYYPNPYRGGTWRFRDSCGYMETGSMAVLDIGAKRREEWLYDIYRMGKDAIDAGASETYLIDESQWDPGTAVKLVNVLRRGGIEVERARAGFTAGGRDYGAGTFLVRGAQPFRAHLTDLLNPQSYPDRRLYPGGPPERPYDITGWTLPYQMGVSVEKVEYAVEVETEPVDWAPVPEGGVDRAGSFGYALDPRANDAFTVVNRLMKSGASVGRTKQSLFDWPPGAFVVEASRERVEALAREHGLVARALDESPADIVPLRLPRIAIYQAWGGNIDEGWTRWVLDQFDFPFTTIHDSDVRAGDLGARFDVIVLPDDGLSSMLSGLDAGTMPPEYIGGMTPEGVYNLYRFTSTGGTLVAMDSASELPVTSFGLAVRDVTRGQDESKFFIPGTILNLDVDNTHPLAWGMAGKAAAFFARSPAFDVGREPTRFERQRGIEPGLPDGYHLVAKYPKDNLLKSGWLMGEGVIAEKAAVVEAPLGDGRVVLLGFRVQHRGQSHQTYKLLFNALLGGGS
ncbi:MAG TPA: M14 family metallopeptidase [Vicinamibacteria bacterium]|nr:M14 family metallopeptidase [Vicinamibacteria bacterium]